MQIFEVPNLWQAPTGFGASSPWQRCYIATIAGQPVGLIVVNDADLIPEDGHKPRPLRQGEAGWDGTGRELEDIYVVEELRGKGPAGELPIAVLFGAFLSEHARCDKLSTIRTTDGEKLAQKAAPDSPGAALRARISSDLVGRYEAGLRTAVEILGHHQEVE